MKRLCAALVAASFAAGISHAGTVSATFDSGTEGFTLTGGILSFDPAGGNPGGGIIATDNQNSEMMLTLPSQFIVPLQLGDSLSFDAREAANPDSNFGGFGELTIQGAGLTATLDLLAGDLTSDWTSFTADFTDSLWNVSGGTLAQLLGGLTSITLNVESGSQVSEVVALDNFVLNAAGIDNPIPVPGAAFLFAPIAGFFAARQARHRNA
ncbi:MAG: hypothetical protein AAGG79_00510 [Pseudomonadota bacterium]